MKQVSSSSHNATRQLFYAGRRLTYKKGEIIERANETPQGVYFLDEGYVKEYSLAKNGTEHFHLIYGPEQLFSIIWAFLGVNQTVYREAFTDVVVYRVEPEVLKKALDQDTVLSHEIRHMLMYQMFSLKTRVENLAFNNAYDKVAYRLLYLAGTLGIKQDDGWFVPLAFRHQQIADSVGITRETASRMLERMTRNGLISGDKKGHFIIRNPSGLARTMDVEEIMQTWPRLKN